jgi:hypothetical protein
MASIARRHQQLTAEIARLDAALEELLALRGTRMSLTLVEGPGRVLCDPSLAAPV